MSSYEAHQITMQILHEKCLDCGCSLSRGDRVWAQTSVDAPRKFWCLKDGNSRFEEKM